MLSIKKVSINSEGENSLLDGHCLENLYSAAGGAQNSSSQVLGSLLAEYTYSAYGDVLMKSGELADKNHVTYSTRYSEGNTGLIYYTYRHYAPRLHKWINKDPIAERGGLNLYQMVGNDTVKQTDILGLAKDPVECCGTNVPLAPDECCIEKNGLKFKKKKNEEEDTGVYLVKEYDGIILKHAWIVYPGGSVGFFGNRAPDGTPLPNNEGGISSKGYGTFSYLFTSTAPGAIISPDPSLNGSMDAERYSQRLKPCEYDIDKFINCLKMIKSSVGPDYAGWWRDCDVWARETIANCKACSKRN